MRDVYQLIVFSGGDVAVIVYAVAASSTGYLPNFGGV
jgi:hypothetical protein